MTKGPIKNLAASVRQRLTNKAKATGRPFQELLQYYAMERFLYRLAQSRHTEHFVLKGALMFTAWKAPATRPTRDIDLLGQMKNRLEAVADAIREICQQTAEPDGLTFDPASVAGRAITEDADYEGVRVTLLGKLGNARIPMQIDVGFGDVITPGAVMAEYPTILDQPAPQLRGYNRETVIAEKFEAMVKLGQLNSRMKDFFDIWLLARQFDFDGPALATAVTRTFAHRRTAISPHPVAMTPEFAADQAKAKQWRAFLRKSQLSVAPTDLGAVVAYLAEFLLPVASAASAEKAFEFRWKAPGPWRPRRQRR